jgi:hypothetical protein
MRFKWAHIKYQENVEQHRMTSLKQSAYLKEITLEDLTDGHTMRIGIRQ